jgi:hypothetical protein
MALIYFKNLVGICSYLLINFWFRRLQANKAAIQAIIINRIGDWGFSLGLFLMFLIFGNLDLTTITTLAPLINGDLLNILTIFLLIGAMAKSAQIGLHIWLPNAMEGLRICIKIIMVVIFILFIENIFLNCQYFILSLPILNLYQSKAIIGDLLGDGHLKKPKTNGNCRLVFTFSAKNMAYIEYMRSKVYGSLCTINAPTPYPTNMPSQYWFATRSLPCLTELYDLWYKSSTEGIKKIVPVDINKMLTPIGLAHWIMGDGYWDDSFKTIVLCTDNFTEEEVLNLVVTLSSQLNLISIPKKRKRETGTICWRIPFSTKNHNVDKLQNMIKPYVISQMLYKLNM